jgi:hypothetical protein
MKTWANELNRAFSKEETQKAKNHMKKCSRWAPITTQEAEIRRTTVQSQPRQIVHETLFQKTHHKRRASGVVQGEGLEFKPYHHKERKRITHHLWP